MANRSGACTICTRFWSANKLGPAPLSRLFATPRNYNCRSCLQNRPDQALTARHMRLVFQVLCSHHGCLYSAAAIVSLMKILIVGSGGREHALAWKLLQSPHAQRIFCAPGNAGTAEIGENVAISASDLDALVRFAKENRVDLTVVGPDDPLAAGIVDLFAAEELRVFGPGKSAARIESSKIFAKELMRARKIPTAEARTFSDSNEAVRYCGQM